MDAVTESLLREGGNYGRRNVDFPVIPPNVQAQRDMEAADIRRREVMPNGGGMIKTADVIPGSAQPTESVDPITAALMREATQSATPQKAQPSQSAAWWKQKPSEALAAMPERNAKQFMADQIQPSDVGSAAFRMVRGIGGTILGGYEGLRILANGGSAKEASDAVKATIERGTGTPDTEGEKKLQMMLGSPMNPMNWPGLVAGKAGQATLDVTGSPGLATAVDTGLNMAPMLLMRGGMNQPVRLPRIAANETVREAAMQPKQIPISQVGQPIDVTAPYTPPVAVNRQAAVTPAAGAVAATPQDAALGGKKMAPLNLAEVTDTAPVTGGLPKTAHPERQAVLQRIGLEQARESAIKGDALKAATDYQLTKYGEEPLGRAAFDQFQMEKSALKNHAERIVQKTGGTAGMDEAALIARGSAVSDALSSLKSYFRNATSNLYKEADKNLGSQAFGVPKDFSKLINTESEFAGKSTNQSLGNGIKSYLREQGIMDKEGAIRPVTVKEVEGIKQYINSQYSHETAGLAGKLKATLDSDVFANAGADVYSAGRQMHQQYMRTLGDPKGVSSIIDVDPRNPMNRAVSLEKIPDTVAKMSNEQYNHLVKTLKEMPPELQPKAQKALAEIQAHWAERLLQRGMGSTPDAMWNAPKVTNEIKMNAEKIAKTFEDNPALLSAIKDLQEAGNILRVNQAYPGASAQAANAVSRGAMTKYLQTIGASAGAGVGATLGPLGAGGGALAGAQLGERAAFSLGERAALKKWKKSTIPLKDMLP